ncbi:MAG TPA: plasma-membrane proton-efflux P-type ATPase, partial [Actinomycetota bacterium]|nr:plasma-membrane proton-efflux P-type ATPase [Actinomycetota bacterium]
ITAAALALAAGVVAESFIDLFLARRVFHLGWPQTQTLMFTMLVFTGQATVYLIRERGRLWSSVPARLLMIASGCDVAVVTLMATLGLLMPAVALVPVLVVLGVAIVSTLLLDPLKVVVLRRLSFS